MIPANTTIEEFEAYKQALTIDTSHLIGLEPIVCTFEEKYNGVEIENPANGKYYYYLRFGDRMFLQNIVPFVSGNNPINDNNLQETIATHKTELINSYIEGEKTRLALEYFLTN